jgi:hypothetical protein
VSSNTFIEQTFEFWLEEFKPITNHIDPHASFDDENGGGIMFETYGEELEFVKKQDPRCVWTYGDGDDGGGYIWNGYHYINRLGYFITEVPCPENTTIQIQVDESPEECAGCGVFIYNEEDDHVCE